MLNRQFEESVGEGGPGEEHEVGEDDELGTFGGSEGGRWQHADGDDEVGSALMFMCSEQV